MKQGAKKLSFQDMEILLNKIIKLFKLIQGKDIFEEKYKFDLAKRLLLDKSVSSDLEEKMISKLKEECGNVYTVKLEGIMKDIESSKDLQNRFENDEKYRENIEKNNMKMVVRIISPSIYYVIYIYSSFFFFFLFSSLFLSFYFHSFSSSSYYYVYV